MVSIHIYSLDYALKNIIEKGNMIYILSINDETMNCKNHPEY